MKRKLLFLALVVVLAAGGLWLGRRTPAAEQAKAGAAQPTSDAQPAPGPMLRPPDPDRKFRNLTPEQRVELARQGPIGG